MQTGTWYFAALTYDSVTGVAKPYLGTPGNIAEVGSEANSLLHYEYRGD